MAGGREPIISFRTPPEGTEYPPALSAPIGHRSILAEVRAPLPPRQQRNSLPSGARGLESTTQSGGAKQPESRLSGKKGETMSIGGKSLAKVDAFAWLSNVKVGVDSRRHGSSSGPGSRGDSGDVSRLSSRSRPGSGAGDGDVSVKRTDSRSRAANDERREGDGSPSLQDE